MNKIEEKEHFIVVKKLDKTQKKRTHVEVGAGEELRVVYARSEDVPAKLPTGLSGKVLHEVSYSELFEVRQSLFAEIKGAREAERKGDLAQTKISRLHELNFVKDSIGDLIEKLSLMTNTTSESFFRKYNIGPEDFS